MAKTEKEHENAVIEDLVRNWLVLQPSEMLKVVQTASVVWRLYLELLLPQLSRTWAGSERITYQLNNLSYHKFCAILVIYQRSNVQYKKSLQDIRFYPSTTFITQDRMFLTKQSCKMHKTSTNLLHNTECSKSNRAVV